MKSAGPSTRDRILSAANKLFYDEGIRATSVDGIAEKAGITKKTLYYHFPSKDNLVEGYLESRDQPNLELFAQWFDACDGTIADKVAAVFTGVGEGARHPKWKGCGFQRTVAELANLPGHPAVQVGARHKKKFEASLTDKFAEASVENPAELARHIVLLMEGTFAILLMHRDPDYADAAAIAARQTVRAAMGHDG